jgi:hypothetical protein
MLCVCCRVAVCGVYTCIGACSHAHARRPRELQDPVTAGIVMRIIARHTTSPPEGVLMLCACVCARTVFALLCVRLHLRNTPFIAAALASDLLVDIDFGDSSASRCCVCVHGVRMCVRRDTHNLRQPNECATPRECCADAAAQLVAARCEWCEVCCVFVSCAFEMCVRAVVYVSLTLHSVSRPVRGNGRTRTRA